MEGLATAHDVVVAAQNASRANLAANPAHLDSTYVREINYFRNWIESQREANIIPLEGPSLTRGNVDLYFSTEVINRPLNHNLARRVVNALQRYADVYLFGVTGGPSEKVANSHAQRG